MKDWKYIIRSFEESGLSVKAYSEQASLKEHSLRYHLKKHSASSLSGFVRVKAHQYSSRLEVCYPNGVRVLVHGEINPTTIASLIYVQPR
jgi:hypothetical protein